MCSPEITETACRSLTKALKSPGLPFIRTSVDHGTAYDMAGRKDVDENSLLEASYLAFNLATRK